MTPSSLKFGNWPGQRTHVCVSRPGGEVAWRRTEDTAGARRPWTREADLPGSSYAHSADFRVCVMGAMGAEAGGSLFFACWIALKTTCKTSKRLLRCPRGSTEKLVFVAKTPNPLASPTADSIFLSARRTGLLIQSLPTASWAPLGQLLNLSEPLLPHMHEDLPQVSVKNK